MKNIFTTILLCSIIIAACTTHNSVTDYVQVRGNAFSRGDSLYTFSGTNMWYAAILGSSGQGGDRERLCRELDTLRARHIMNIRSLAGGSDGVSKRSQHTWPSLQPAPGTYNDTILEGLDFFIAELEKRGMTCVLYLNNSWDWSGGMGTYLEWAGAGEAPDSSKDWDSFQEYTSKFTSNAKALELSARHTRFIVSRTNSITGRPYTESPAIMAWEICNEPRPFTQRRGITEEEKEYTWRAFAAWIESQAKLIKSIDKNHLVTTGSEGLYGCAKDSALLLRIHTFPSIDYCSIHCWPNNWGWCGQGIAGIENCRELNGVSAPQDSLENAMAMSSWYIYANCRILGRTGKPIVLEEYGYPRDNYETAPGTGVTARNAYYRFIQGLKGLAGTNFWGWGGEASPVHTRWQKWDPYTADPAQEEQGLYSVFTRDAQF